MSAKENLRYAIISVGISALALYASPHDTKDIDLIRLSSNNTIGPTPDMVDRFTPTPTPVPTVGITPTAEPTHIINPEAQPTRVSSIPAESPIIVRPPQESTPTSEIVEGLNYQWASEILNLTNQFRAKNGLAPYHPDSRLKAAAEKYAAYYFKNGDPVHLDHYLCNNNGDCSPWERVVREGYGKIFTQVTENMASGYNSADETFAGWLGSPPHRANILSSIYEDIGVGCYLGIHYSENRPYKFSICVQDFGLIPPDPPPPVFLPTPTSNPTPTSASTPTPEPTFTPTPEPVSTPTIGPSPTPAP